MSFHSTHSAEHLASPYSPSPECSAADSVGANYSDTIRQAIIYDFHAATAAPILLDEDGETTNVPDDDDALEKGADGQAGPAWMAKWSEACSAAAGGSGEEDDEFNVEFMANSARLYDEAAGLASAAKL